MTSRHGRASLAAAATLAATVVACSAAAPTPPASRASESAAPRSVAAGPVIDVPAPGKPFDAADILAAMAGSRRPGGVPAELQTDEIAAAVADVLWTFDGSPWPSITAGGTCGSDACTLELAGRAADAVGEDVWVLRIDPASGSVEVETTDLHAVPPALADQLDAHARRAQIDPRIDDLLVTSVRWLPPPDDGTFQLAYRSGNEEGSCSVGVEVDARTGSVEATSATGC